MLKKKKVNLKSAQVWIFFFFVVAISIWQSILLTLNVRSARQIAVALKQMQIVADQTVNYLIKDVQTKDVSMYKELSVIGSRDPWDTSYRVEIFPQMLRIHSAGPDSLFNTADDLQLETALTDLRSAHPANTDSAR